MNCEWCYVPFGSAPATSRLVNDVVSRIADLGFTTITIGGGDPFQYSFMSNTLRHAKASRLFVHVDTHGKSLRQSALNLELIEEAVDLIGLPLDGSESRVHDQMRGSLDHFDLVCRRIEWLGSLRSRLKVNTVVSSLNAHDITKLGMLLCTLGPARWSVYQYWPLGPAARVASKHLISDAEFSQCTAALAETTRHSGLVVEVIPPESRRDTYPIIHHDGEVFAHKAFPDNEFVSLGSIFDLGALESICSACSAGRPLPSTRYLTRIYSPEGASDG